MSEEFLSLHSTIVHIIELYTKGGNLKKMSIRPRCPVAICWGFRTPPAHGIDTKQQDLDQ